MADLFEEYGALEYEKPKKKLKLPKLPVPPKWILWLVIAAVAIGAVALVYWLTRDAPFWMTEEEKSQTLEKCEKALAEFQSRDSVYVHWETGYSDTPVQDYWRCGGDVYYISTLGGALFQGHLEWGGEQYSTGRGQVWKRASFSKDQLRLMWLDTYRWNAEDITLVSRKDTGAGREATLLIQGSVDPNMRAFRDMENYTVCMHLDEAGTLTAVTLSYRANKNEETQIYQINPISREEAKQTIETAYWGIVDEITEGQYFMLKKCQEGLEELREKQSYYIRREIQHLSSSVGEIERSEIHYWRSGEDLLEENWTEKGQIQKSSLQKGTLRVGGIYDSKGGKMVWGVLYGGTYLMIPWLETYSWDSEDVISVREMENIIWIAFQGDPFYREDGSVKQYDIGFAFEESGLLNAIHLSYVENNSIRHSSVFNIIPTDTQEISQAIDKAYQEAVGQVLLDSAP